MDRVNQAQPIGVFDSGLGGLTVVREIWEELPYEQILYFGDTARVPYGGRSLEEIQAFNAQIIEFLLAQGAKAIIFACNTSTALALEVMRERYPVPMFGIIKPGAKAAVAATRNGRVGLIATEATVKSGAYHQALYSLRPDLTVVEEAAPKLVPLIEAGEIDTPATRGSLREYLTPMVREGVDTIIYGCTHYPFLEPVIKEMYPDRFELVNPARSCVLEVKEYLTSHGFAAQAKAGEDQYYVSGDPGKFQVLGSGLISGVLPVPRKVDVFASNVLHILP